MRWLIVILAAFMVAAAGCSNGAHLDLKHRYLLIDVAGPPEWEKKHAFSIKWKDKDVPLPVVIRVTGELNGFDLGSGGEIFGHLVIGKEKAPVSATPDTEFQVRNTGISAFISEKRTQKDSVAISIASSVLMSPPSHPGELAPAADKEETESAGKKLEKRIKELIAAGRVIDVQASR